MALFKGFIKSCVVCSAQFKVSPSQDRVQTCSRECGYKARKVANKKDPVRLSCAQCGVAFNAFPSQADRRIFCSTKCKFESPEFKQAKSDAISGSKNPAWRGGASVPAVSRSGRHYHRSQPAIEAEKNARRKRAKGLATPAWADMSKIRSVYREAARLTKTTGEPHHVDHVVPLISPVVCGLHTHHNLQIIPAFINLSKGNRLHA